MRRRSGASASLTGERQNTGAEPWGRGRGATPLPRSGSRAAAALGTAPGQRQGRGSATRWPLPQEGRGQRSKPRTGTRWPEPGWPSRPSRPSRQRPGGDAHRRGRSTAPQAGGRRGRRPGDSGRPGAGAGPCRSMAAPGGRKRGWRGEGEGQTCVAARTPRRSATGRAHLGVAADAARRVCTSLRLHAQRAGPVEAQAASAGRQESSQVLIACELLRWPGHQQSQPEDATTSERSQPTCPEDRSGRRPREGPCQGPEPRRPEPLPLPRAPRSPGPEPRRCALAGCGRPGRGPPGKSGRGGRRRRRGGRARVRRPLRRGRASSPWSATSVGRATRSGRGRGRTQGHLAGRWAPIPEPR